MSFLSIDRITKTYRGAKKPCLEELSLDVEKGEILVFLGQSGCGKTTLLKIIAGLEDQDSGTVTVDGECIDKLSSEKRPISMVFQKPYLFKNMTVSGNISFAPKINGYFKTKEEMKAETQKYIDLVKLTGLEDRMATQLSGGQEQRVSLARALIMKPKLLLLDEPLSALDASLRVEMRTGIRSICKELEQTVIFVTHDQEEAVAIGDRIALMGGGNIIQCSSPEEFYHHPKTATVAKFFGWKNFIPCKYDGTGKVESAIGKYHVDGYDGTKGNKLMIIRPEAFYENINGPVKGIVKESSFMGVRVDYTIDVNGTELFASLDTSYIRRHGEEIQLDINRGGIWLVEDEPLDEPEHIMEEIKGLKKLFSKFKKE